MKRGQPFEEDNAPVASAGTCGGKMRYASRKDAVTMANFRTRGRSKRRHNRPTYLRAYSCPLCDGWHITSKQLRRFP